MMSRDNNSLIYPNSVKDAKREGQVGDLHPSLYPWIATLVQFFLFIQIARRQVLGY